MSHKSQLCLVILTALVWPQVSCAGQNRRQASLLIVLEFSSSLSPCLKPGDLWNNKCHLPAGCNFRFHLSLRRRWVKTVHWEAYRIWNDTISVCVLDEFQWRQRQRVLLCLLRRRMATLLSPICLQVSFGGGSLWKGRINLIYLHDYFVETLIYKAIQGIHRSLHPCLFQGGLISFLISFYLGVTQQRSGLIPGSQLRNHSWCGLGDPIRWWGLNSLYNCYSLIFF